MREDTFYNIIKYAVLGLLGLLTILVFASVIVLWGDYTGADYHAGKRFWLVLYSFTKIAAYIVAAYGSYKEDFR